MPSFTAKLLQVLMRLASRQARRHNAQRQRANRPSAGGTRRSRLRDCPGRIARAPITSCRMIARSSLRCVTPRWVRIVRCAQHGRFGGMSAGDIMDTMRSSEGRVKGWSAGGGVRHAHEHGHAGAIPRPGGLRLSILPHRGPVASGAQRMSRHGSDDIVLDATANWWTSDPAFCRTWAGSWHHPQYRSDVRNDPHRRRRSVAPDMEQRWVFRSCRVVGPGHHTHESTGAAGWTRHWPAQSIGRTRSWP